MSKKFKTYHIHCGKCDEYILTYHKHGAGKGILRLYFSNIHAPEKLVEKLNDAPNLCCPSCKEVLGVPSIGKGQKWVFRIRQGYFHRKLIK